MDAHSQPLTPNNSSIDTPIEDSGKTSELDRIATALELLAFKLALPATLLSPNAVETSIMDEGKDVHTEAEERCRASGDVSQPEYTIVRETWKDSSSCYQIESSVSIPREDEYDHFVFVVRERIDRKTQEGVFYVDIKSEGLCEILRLLLRDVNGINLRDPKLSLDRNLLYHFLFKPPHWGNDVATLLRNRKYQSQFDLLIRYIQQSYTTFDRSVQALVDNGEITFEKLWYIFKPNDLVFSRCIGTNSPRCVVFDRGSVKSLTKDTRYFKLEGRYVDFDGKTLGQVEIAIGIMEFDGTKRIHELEAFPLCYHGKEDEVRHDLITRGKKFTQLNGICFRQYSGVAFFEQEGTIVKNHIEGRIAVDCPYFFETNPNYEKPRMKDFETRNNFNGWIALGESHQNAHIVKSTIPDYNHLTDDQLLICSPTIPGFSFKAKKWLEFAVANISNIEWNPEPFERLAIPSTQKDLIRSAAASHIDAVQGPFKDFVVGKGQGLIVLLHGPPGVGKTLTAEGLAEDLKRPLYTVSTAQLPPNTSGIESLLENIFRNVKRWNAVLLIDEADVFMRQRSLDLAHNTYVSMFLRKLEYFKGIMILTTNRVRDFDDAILSRVHLPIAYHELGRDTRAELWGQFLQRDSHSTLNAKEIGRLAEHQLNGRQIKNTVQLASQLAYFKGCSLSHSAIEDVLKMTGDFPGGRGVEVSGLYR